MEKLIVVVLQVFLGILLSVIGQISSAAIL